MLTLQLLKKVGIVCTLTNMMGSRRKSYIPGLIKKVQVGNDQEMAQSERSSNSINRGVGKS